MEHKKKKGTVRAAGPEVTEQEDNYQKQEVKQYIIELGQISTRPKGLGFIANMLNRSTRPAKRAIGHVYKWTVLYLTTSDLLTLKINNI